MMSNNLESWKRILVAVVAAAVAPSWAAGDGAGEVAVKPKPMRFILNVGNTPESMRFLQAEVALEYATVEAEARFSAFRPKLMHHIILWLCDADTSTLLSEDGKRHLQGRIADGLNAVFNETVKTGVREVYFTDFLIQ